MHPRPAAGALVALALLLALDRGRALAQPPAAPPPPAASPAPAAPPAAPAPSAPPAAKGGNAPTAPQPQAQAKGAVVVAVSEGAAPAARALAFDLYREADLLPSIDDAAARVLAGEAPPAAAPARLKELAELRASIVQALAPPPTTGGPVPPPTTGAPPVPPPAPTAPSPAPPSPAPPASDLVARRLLASLGTEVGAVLVVTVAMDGSRPVARALRTATAAFERIVGPTVDIGADGARTYRWPGASATLRGLLTIAEAPKPAPPPGPLAPKSEAAPAPPAAAGSTPFYKSPWFYGSVGGAVVVGLSVFLISRATSSTTDVHLMGKVGP